MNRYFLAALLLIGACAQPPQERRLELWYDEPATEWTEALPVGAGRLGAMVFGGVSAERIDDPLEDRPAQVSGGICKKWSSRK